MYSVVNYSNALGEHYLSNCKRQKTTMPVTETLKKQTRVSDIIKAYEEKITPPQKNIKLVRDILRPSTVVESCKKFRNTYMQKLQKAKYTTWHVRSSNFFDGSDITNDCADNTYATNSTPLKNSDNEDIKPKVYMCSKEIVQKNQPNSQYGDEGVELRNENICYDSSNSNDAKQDVGGNTIILGNQYVSKQSNQYTSSDNGDLKIGLTNEYFEDNGKGNLDATISVSEEEITLCNDSNLSDSNDDLRNAVTISSEVRSLWADNDSIDIRDNELVVSIDKPIRESNNVISWIKECQFSDDLDKSLLLDQASQTEDTFPEPNDQIKSRIIVVDEEANEGNIPCYENIEIYRRNVQRELTLIENIQALEDDDCANDLEKRDDAFECPDKETHELQHANIPERIYEPVSTNGNDQDFCSYISIDEIDITNKGIFGKGICAVKIRTDYWEIINPLYNKTAPNEFFNEVIHLTSVPIDIAKYINKTIDKHEDTASVDGLVIGSEYEADKLDIGEKCHSFLEISDRVRCDSTYSVGTIGSDDFLHHASDDHSSSEDVPSSGLIRTDSKLMRVDQTYYNNKVRITKYVVVEELSKVTSKLHSVDELVQTEANNLIKLEYVRDRYMPEIQRMVNNDPNKNLKYKSSYIFLNWHDIYTRACRFYERIEACGYNYQELAEVILNSRELFEEYSIYCKNKAKAERYLQGEIRPIVESVQEKLGDKLGLSSYLLEPVQRLTKFKLPLEALQKELIKTGQFCQTLKLAIDMIKTITSESNDCIDASYIKNPPFDLKAQGRIICKGTFNVIKARPKTKWLDMKIFLFENVLIIAAPVKLSDEYIYKDHIFMGNMQFSSSDMPRKFIIADYFQNKQANDNNYKTFTCTHKNEDVIMEWTNLITNYLMEQFQTLKNKLINDKKVIKHNKAKSTYQNANNSRR